MAVAALCAFFAAWLFIPPRAATRLLELEGATDQQFHFRTRMTDLMFARHKQTLRHAERRTNTIAAITALAAELRSGCPPVRAIAITAGEPPAWPAARAVAEQHGDVTAALVTDSVDNPELRALCACWRVGVNSGSGLATSISRLAHSLNQAQVTRHQLAAELAGPRATSRMLALLPLVGIGLGYLLGASPLTWLLTEPVGWVTLCIGVGLTALGVWWTSRITAQVERML
ncbi:MAG: hypothetical protein K9G12_05185 [Candidatus Nanopelagicales bacterium]|nr:hypothetical protein [Candidatus Nanopelagicales bacterium]